MRDHQPGEDVKGNTDPVRTHVPGRWRITLSNVRPEGSWREHLLERAQEHTRRPGAALGDRGQHGRVRLP